MAIPPHTNAGQPFRYLEGDIQLHTPVNLHRHIRLYIDALRPVFLLQKLAVLSHQLDQPCLVVGVDTLNQYVPLPEKLFQNKLQILQALPVFAEIFST